MISTKFIKATNAYCTYEKNICAPYVRKAFLLEGVPESAEITLTCTGFYRLWVNGKEITGSRLAPYITNPDQIIFYDKYDISELLVKGKNCIALMLGNGMSNCMGGYIWDFDKALFRSAPKLALHMEAKCGENVTAFEADESFMCAPSPIYFDDLRSGEFYDATMEIPGWNLPDFDDSSWCNAIPAEPARGRCEYNNTDKVVITKELRPVKVTEGRISPIDPGRLRPVSAEVSKNTFYKPEETEEGYVFEFAENAAFVPKLRIKGKKGQRIILQCAEFCTGNNEVAYENIQRFYPVGFCQRDIYICKGEEVEEYIPSFTYHGARYIIVIGADKEQISEDTVTMLVMNSELPERGSFTCSDEIANALQKNTRISTLANFVYYPTDCPHREKNGWTGDAAVSAEHMMQNLAVEKSWKQWLKMVCSAQKPNGQLPGIVPTSGWGYEWGNGPVWDQALVELPYITYIYRGDISLFCECASSVMRYLNYISGKRSSRGTVNIGLGDWCHALRKHGGSDHVCANDVSDTITCIGICRKAAEMFEVCGMTAQALFAETLADEFLAAARKHLIDFGTMTVKSNCQTAQAMGLYYDVFENGEKPAAYNKLLELIHRADDHFDCGMIGVRIIFRTLAKHGDAELAYRMITRTDAPSYGMWVKEYGLASMAESFRDTMVDGNGTSLNHHFLADISGFFIAHIAGLQINPYGDNAAYVRINPAFISTLDNASAYYDTVKGRVEVNWERKGDLIKLTASKADGIGGEVILPDGYVFAKKAGAPDTYMEGRCVYALENVTYYIRKV